MTVETITTDRIWLLRAPSWRFEGANLSHVLVEDPNIVVGLHAQLSLSRPILPLPPTKSLPEDSRLQSFQPQIRWEAQDLCVLQIWDVFLSDPMLTFIHDYVGYDGITRGVSSNSSRSLRDASSIWLWIPECFISRQYPERKFVIFFSLVGYF